MAKIDITDLRARCLAVPQKLMLEMLGFRQWLELQRFADKWKLPIGGATTDLFAVGRALRLFVAKYGTILSAVMEDLPTDGSEGELGVRYLKAKIDKTEQDARASAIRNELREGNLLDRARVHEIFERLAARVQRASDKAQSRWGSDGHDFMQTLVEGFETDIRSVVDLDLPDQPASDSEQ